MRIDAYQDDGKVIRRTKIEKPERAFTAVIKRADLAMNFSYGSSEAEDGQGNKIKVFLWVSGDWHVEYKGKEYIIPINENVTALVDWINENDQEN